MFVGEEEAIDAGFVSLSLSHVLSSLDEATNILGLLEFDDGVVGAFEIVGVANGERQMEARVLMLYDLVESLELLGQHFLVNLHDVVGCFVRGVDDVVAEKQKRVDALKRLTRRFQLGDSKQSSLSLDRPSSLELTTPLSYRQIKTLLACS